MRTFRLILIPCIVGTLFYFSCTGTHRESVKKTNKSQYATLLSQDDYQYLAGTIDFMENITLLRKLGASYENIVVPPEQFDRVADRRTLLIRFGMLCSDLAYERIVGRKIQTETYDELFQRYLNDLNLTSVVTADFKAYFDILTENELTDSLFTELTGKFRNDRKLLIENLKNHEDEDFLIFFTMGTEIELFHLMKPFIENDTTYQAFRDINGYGYQAGSPVCQVYYRVWNKEELNKRFKEHQAFMAKINPAYELIGEKTSKELNFTREDIGFIFARFDEIRTEILK